MLFCENDDNMLYIKVDNDGDNKTNLIYYCKLCGEEYNMKESVKIKIDKIKQRINVWLQK